MSPVLAALAVAAIATAAATTTNPEQGPGELEDDLASGSGDSAVPTSSPTPSPSPPHVVGDMGTIACGQQVTGNTTEHGLSTMGNRAYDHWYTFEVTAATDHGEWVFDSCGSEFDTYLRLYSVDGGNELSPRPINSCDDCGNCGLQTILRTDASSLPAGRYALLIEGYGRNHGSYTVAMRCPVGGATPPQPTSAPTTSASTPTPTTPLHVGANNMGTIQCNEHVSGNTTRHALDTVGRASYDHWYTFSVTDLDSDSDSGNTGEIFFLSDGVDGDPDTPGVGFGSSSGFGLGSGSGSGSAATSARSNWGFDSCGSEFDTFVRVFCVLTDGALHPVAACDDCGDCGLAAVLNPRRELHNGDYALLIEGYDPDEHGRYDMVLTCGNASDAPTGAPTASPTTEQHHLNVNNMGTIACGQQVTGNTTEHGLSTTGNRAYDHWYTFEVTAATDHGEWVFDSCGSEFDTYLRLYSVDGGNELSPRPINSCDDCGNCGLQTILRTDASSLPAGRYALLIEGYGRNHGSYTVAMRCPALIMLAPLVTTTAPTPAPTPAVIISATTRTPGVGASAASENDGPGAAIFIAAAAAVLLLLLVVVLVKRSRHRATASKRELPVVDPVSGKVGSTKGGGGRHAESPAIYKTMPPMASQDHPPRSTGGALKSAAAAARRQILPDPAVLGHENNYDFADPIDDDGRENDYEVADPTDDDGYLNIRDGSGDYDMASAL